MSHVSGQFPLDTAGIAFYYTWVPNLTRKWSSLIYSSTCEIPIDTPDIWLLGNTCVLSSQGSYITSNKIRPLHTVRTLLCRNGRRIRYRGWQIEHNRNQECIPVGCVPPASVAVSPARTRPPPLPCQTGVKTLPSRNFVCGR